MMARKGRMSVVMAAAVGLLAGAGAAPAGAQDLPEFVNWSLDGAYQRDNGPRATICLNGWWRWRTAVPPTDVDEEHRDKALSPDTWYWRKVPGVGTNFHVLNDAGERVLRSLPRPLSLRYAGGRCEVEREFTVPAGWRDRRVQLVFENVLGDGEIWLDGKKLGHTWSMRPHHVDLPRPYKMDKPYRLRIAAGGVIANVWLKAYTHPAAQITDSYLMTSVRNMNATIRASGRGDAAAVRVVITEYQSPDEDPKPAKTVKTVGPVPVAVGSDGTWRVEHTFDWKDAKLWSLSRPHLYRYSLELLDADGNVVDRIFPIRFGFREIWIRGGDIMINNRRITLTIDTHTPLATSPGYGGGWRRAGHTARPEVWREAFRRWKKVGVNTAVFRWSQNVDDSTMFRVADEEGFLLAVSVYGLQGGDPNIRKLPKIQQHKIDMVRALILPRRHCPSVAYYYLPGTSNTWDFEPKKLGADYDAEKLFGRHNRPERALVHELDPTRIAFAGSGGGKAEPVHSSMNYIHIDADLRVHATWPSWWYRTKPKPLATYEQSAPPYIADWYMRRSRGEQAHGTAGAVPFFLEVAAIYLGEEPYLTEPREHIEGWLTRVAEGKHAGSPRGGSLSWIKVAKLFEREVFRSWRTYGVNPSFHTQVRGYFAGKPYYVQPVEADPRRPGLLADERISLADPFRHEPLTSWGKVAERALEPLLVYLGGPDGKFVQKDRAFYGGETIRKAVVMVNELDDPAVVSGTWELAEKDGGQVVQRGKVPRTELAPGELAPAKVHIKVTAPKVQQRTEYVLRLRAEADQPGSLEDEFELAVFPTPPAVKIPDGMKIHLYDPAGETTALLRKAGVPFEPVGNTLPDPKTSLLIVGRNALRTPGGREGIGKLLYRKMGYDFATDVSNGLRVLVFEQPLDNVWGLKTEQTRWRRAWIAAEGHPAFEGLGKGDFICLRGDSDLAEAYPDAPPGKYGRVATDRFSEWGNDNVVTTYTFIRPQIGAMRGLILCGFDQQETPLLEAAAGTGRMMFCQVDVTNRYGADPVSTRLVNNLLTYMTHAAPPDPSVPRPTDLVREGAEDYAVTMKTEKVFMVDKPAGPLSWGISAADLYFEGFVNLPALVVPEGRRQAYGRLNDGTVVHTLNSRSFGTKWQKMKARMVRSALRINAGGSATDFPGPSYQGDNEQFYPLDWLEGFVHPYLMMQW